MARKRYKAEEIVAKLRQVDVLVSQGQNMVDVAEDVGGLVCIHGLALPFGFCHSIARKLLTLRALPPLLPLPFLPSRLLAPAELFARRLGPLICHCITPLRSPRPAGARPDNFIVTVVSPR
jgi:hypothetical protein